MNSARRSFVFGLAQSTRVKAGPVSPPLVLEAVAEQYTLIKKYSLEVKTWHEHDSSPGTREITNSITISYADATHFHFENRPNSGGTIVVVADGVSYWHYISRIKEYIVEAIGAPVAKGAPSRIADSFARQNAHLFARFRNINHFSRSAKFLGEKTLKTGTARADTVLIELTPHGEEPGANWMERVWIDAAHSIVVQSAYSDRLALQGRSWRFSRYRFLPAPAAGSATYQFHPPRPAKRVTQFTPSI